MGKTQSFVKEVLARIQGDESKAVAERNYRKASAAVKGQVSSLESKKVDAEVALEDAKEALNAAIYPTEPIKDNSGYVRNVAKAQKVVASAEQDLVDVNDSLEYFTKLGEQINA